MAKQIKTKAYRTMREAHEAAQKPGEWAITIDGNYVVLDGDTIARLERGGREFAFITLHDGRIMTVPVN